MNKSLKYITSSYISKPLHSGPGGVSLGKIDTIEKFLGIVLKLLSFCSVKENLFIFSIDLFIKKILAF